MSEAKRVQLICIVAGPTDKWIAVLPNPIFKLPPPAYFGGHITGMSLWWSYA